MREIFYLTNDEKQYILNLATKIIADPSEHPNLFCEQSKFNPIILNHNMHDLIV